MVIYMLWFYNIKDTYLMFYEPLYIKHFLPPAPIRSSPFNRLIINRILYYMFYNILFAWINPNHYHGKNYPI